MEQLLPFVDLSIDWDLTPEHAVTMYLEWGNNDWNAQYGPVRSKSDVSTYFVLDTWGQGPVVRLVRRNSEGAEDLTVFPLPDFLLAEFQEEVGSIKGIFAPNDSIKGWLRQVMQQ